MRLQALQADLRSFEPADALEAEHRARILDLLERAGDRAFDRDHFTPGHITASGFVVDPQREKILLIFHGKLHRWLQPGGHVEPDDVDVRAAVIREIREEVGLTVEGGELFDVDVHDIAARKADPQHGHYDVRYLFTASGEAVAGDDAADARWWPIQDVNLVDSDESIMRAIRKLVR